MPALSYADYLKDEFLKETKEEFLDAALKKDFDKDLLTLLQVNAIQNKWKNLHKNDYVSPSGMDINYIL